MPINPCQKGGDAACAQRRGLRVEHPMHDVVTPDYFKFLQSLDTPTVCNLIEIVAPQRRGQFYTVKHLHCPFPDLPAMVGFAKTVRIQAKTGDGSYMQRRLDYLDYVAAGSGPRVVVVEDLDGDDVGYGAFWGEVQSTVHQALGCLGTITNGSVRDLPMIPKGFQMLAGSIGPSHAYVHLVDFGGAVNVHGMATMDGDLVHADRHGAVVVPQDKITDMQAALAGLTAREARILAAARAPDMTVETIKAAIRS
jgi:regulator of RNase E activity RraA